ncbi:hypothetical protein LCER1_G007207 [Lachnellula cervina]|uniref:Reverse transcriptase domain-containing protein n=1 Tax=Lachnellula cervina TaxID=1316786 RepID=A0A7D8UJ18_9HELO|nr:hypothetical protein LCER1_G007207 [Lachnellula cervina]
MDTMKSNLPHLDLTILLKLLLHKHNAHARNSFTSYLKHFLIPAIIRNARDKQTANKPCYKQPSAYCPISLLNCLRKVSERIFAKRLAHLAETTLNLLYNSQIGGRLKKLATDVGAILADYIYSNCKRKKITSTLFLNIKGAYNYILKNRLLTILQDLLLPDLLIL